MDSGLFCEGNMTNRNEKRGNSVWTLIFLLLLLALVAVMVYIIWQLLQYRLGEAYYDGLREAGWCRGRMLA